MLAPPSQPEPVVDVLHGVEVVDPFRWLEDQGAPQTRNWIKAQTAYTRRYFDSVPGRERIRSRVKQLLEYKGTISDTWEVGEHLFFLKRGLASEQPSIFMRDGLLGEDRVLIDPMLSHAGAQR